MGLPDKLSQSPTTLKTSPKQTTELPLPVLSTVENDLSNVHNTSRQDQDADEYPESEPESEPETKPETNQNNGSDLIACTNMILLIAAILSAFVL